MGKIPRRPNRMRRGVPEKKPPKIPENLKKFLEQICTQNSFQELLTRTNTDIHFARKVSFLTTDCIHLTIAKNRLERTLEDLEVNLGRNEKYQQLVVKSNKAFLKLLGFLKWSGIESRRWA